MSWHYSQALVEEFLEANSLDGTQCVQLNMNRTPQLYSQSGKMMEFCKRSQSGMTCQHLTASLGEELLTWFLGDFLVKISAAQEKVRELRAVGQDFGRKCYALFLKYDQDTSSLRTHQCLWVEDLEWSFVTLPKWGMMQDGVFWGLMTSAAGTTEKDAGYWPTPLKQEGPGGSHKKLTDAIAIAEGYKPKYYIESGTEDREVFCGKVNPDWTEWLMGWPVGWTDDSQELGMDKFQQWLQQHGICSKVNSNKIHKQKEINKND
jgi:hypothetical protein